MDPTCRKHRVAPASPPRLHLSSRKLQVGIEKVGLAFERGEMNVQGKISNSAPLCLGVGGINFQLGTRQAVGVCGKEMGGESSFRNGAPRRLSSRSREGEQNIKGMQIKGISADIYS